MRGTKSSAVTAGAVRSLTCGPRPTYQPLQLLQMIPLLMRENGDGNGTESAFWFSVTVRSRVSSICVRVTHASVVFCIGQLEYWFRVHAMGGLHQHWTAACSPPRSIKN
jgi:hypothetical protein